MIEELYNENLLDSPDEIERVIEGGEDRAYASDEGSGFKLIYRSDVHFHDNRHRVKVDVPRMRPTASQHAQPMIVVWFFNRLPPSVASLLFKRFVAVVMELLITRSYYSVAEFMDDNVLFPSPDSQRQENESEGHKSDEDKKKENEDDKDKKSKVRRKLGPRMVLNAQRLNGPRGIGVMETFFSDLKLHGKGREREDLEAVMKQMEHWAHRLAPRLQFDDCLKKIEKLGSKKEVANKVKRIRLGMDTDDDVVRDDGGDNAPDSPPPPDDPFDQLIASSVAAPPHSEMTAEQREQMLRNRLLAEERRAARIKKAQEMKLRFQERLANSQTVNSQSADLPESAVDVQPSDENMVVGEVEEDDLVGSVSRKKTNTDSVDVVVGDRSSHTIRGQTDDYVSLENTDFERMLVDVDGSQTSAVAENDYKSLELTEEIDKSNHDSGTE